ncbi:MAG: hypothetical protein CVU87_11075 [Firmicutes bacterium HGW-Firmicutes-12]|jgi:UDP-N-acetyl-D-mannosaminuronic acid dehydrogenase|nr:MAG: hypothetical protein CVU87_11075 [Firmicutes bacterium HGW-Firmicutes-12]
MVCRNYSNIFIITIGTQLNEQFIPIYANLLEIISSIINLSNKPVSIFLRSTIEPGTSKIISNHINKLGKEIGKDVFYAYCPERILEGKAFEELGKIPQIIGAFDDISIKIASNLFSEVLGVRCIIGKPIEAEYAKIFNNMYRYINFALANEFMCLAEKNYASMKKVLEMCNTEYPRSCLSNPGYASGPCLFKDGFFLTNELPFIELVHTSWKINESLPHYILTEVEKIRTMKNVTILGLSFKEGSDDIRNSLGIKMLNLLKNRGLNVTIHDPFVKYLDKTEELKTAIQDATELFVMVPHKEYKELSKNTLTTLSQEDLLVVDPWYIWNDNLFTLLNPTRHKI